MTDHQQNEGTEAAIEQISAEHTEQISAEQLIAAAEASRRMFYSGSTRGFYNTSIHGDSMPGDVVEITEEHHAELLAAQGLGRVIVVDGDGLPVAREAPPVAVVVPAQVTMRQARLALLAAGKLTAVGVAIAALPSPQKKAAQIEWEYAGTVDRNSPFVQLMSAGLQLDDAALDALFSEAATL